MLEAIAKNQFKDETICITKTLEKLLRHIQQEPLIIRQNVRQNFQDGINWLQNVLRDALDELEYSKLQARVEEKTNK